MGTVPENQTSEHHEAENRSGRENLGGGVVRGELLRRGAEGSYETGVQCLYLPLDDTPSLPAGSHPWGWECRALTAGRRRRRSRRGQRSAGARCTRPPPPPVPLCHEPALTPGTELCGRSVPRKRVAGLLACCIQVYPGSCVHPQSRGSRSSAPTDSSPERRQAAAAVEAKGWSLPCSATFPTCSRGWKRLLLPARGALLSESCLCLQGSRLTPDLWHLLHRRKAPVVDTEEALKMWAGTRHLQSSHPPPPLRSHYLSNGKSL